MNKPILTEKEKIALAMNNAGDGKGVIVDLSGKTVEQLQKQEDIKKINKEMEVYAEAYKDHINKVQEATEQISTLNPEKLEISPIGYRILVKPLATNPFQKIKQDNGLIYDLGGMAPIFKNTDSGELQQEEEFIVTGVVQEVGPETKYIQVGDVVFYHKPNATPIPFFKSGLVLIQEPNILAVVNESLKERWNGK